MTDNWLKPYGLNAIALPRRDLHPNDLLLKDDGSFGRKAGTLSMLLQSGTPLPRVTENEPTASLGKDVTRKFEASFGLKLLGALIGAGAAEKLGVETSIRDARELHVSYEDVLRDSVAVLEMQAWAEQAEVDGPSQGMIWLNDEKLAAITSVVKSAKLSVVAKREDGASLELDIPEISGIVSGTAKVSGETNTAEKVTFEGTSPIAFGVEAYVLIYEGNVFYGTRPMQTVDVADIRDYAYLADQELQLADQPASME